MTTVREMTPPGDAPAGAETPYRLSLPGTHIFEGALADNSDEDWVAVELEGGETYSITLSGIGDNVRADTILAVYNSARKRVAYHDDVDYNAGHLHSVVDAFVPAAGGVYYISVSAYTGNPAQDHSGDYRLSVAVAGGVFIGTAGNDALVGGAGADQLDGRAGDDRLEGGPGADILVGGAGEDTVSYATSPAGVHVDLSVRSCTDYPRSGSDHCSTAPLSSPATARGGDAEGDTFSRLEVDELVDPATGLVWERHIYIDIENLIGSAHDDVLIGSNAFNYLYGGPGDDRLVGGPANNGPRPLEAWGSYVNILEGGPGADRLIGGPQGADYTSYRNSDAGVSVNLATGGSVGDAKGDTFQGIERIHGSDYDDILVGDEGGNFIRGHGGNDKLVGGGGTDFLFGNAGDDDLDGGPANDLLYGREGNDTGRGGTGDDVVDGGDGDDVLYGGSGDDFLFGGGGGDVLIGGPGADWLEGGDGADTAGYRGSAAAVTVNLATNTGSGGDAEGDTFDHIDYPGISTVENLIGSAYNDTLTGDGGANELRGGGGDDTLDGKDGDDVLYGGPGADTFVFGPGRGHDRIMDFAGGTDRIDLSAFKDSGNIDTDDATANDGNHVIELPDGGTVTVVGSGDDALNTGDYFTTLITLEMIFGSDDNDTLTGDGRANELHGGGGDDTLDGKEGDDVLIGGPDADRLIGGAGADTASYRASAAAVIVNLMANTASGGDAEGDTFTGIENLVGSGHNDRLVGNGGANKLYGGEGHDRLWGDGGDDVLDGGSDFDYLYGGHGNDTLYGMHGADFLHGHSGDDVLYGGPGNDWLYGEYGSDVLIGGPGRDVLRGGRGADTLYGGAGPDFFLFGIGHGHNLIMDFEIGMDKISMSEQISYFGSVNIDDATANDGNHVIKLADAGMITVVGVGDDALNTGDHFLFD